MRTYWHYPHIDPVAFSIGPIEVHWYGLMYLVGFIFALFCANRYADRDDNDWNRNQVSDLLFYCFLGVILGGRIGYVLFYQFPLFISHPVYIFKIWDGGMSFHGGLIGVILAMFYFARKTHRHFFVVADVVAPLVPFGLGAGRIGNFINGELWGRVTDVPWALIYPDAGPLPRHPSEIYEFLLEGVLLLIILQVYSRRKPPLGAVSGMFMFLYGCFRCFAECFRQPDPQLGFFSFGTTMGQILSIPMIIIGAWILIWSYRRAKRRLIEK
ncbi:prolipoprotein diacylglyceryl transferase [Celerinatantimonas diazotrophica]|uniref:Phosphatidylglycerol--prolipoprotein diacylglyceryl transferase n=1 Tax=Celerinatantimonas diazotrophica TaxID=412034 RepID=A0A4V2PNH3_9GAMM|nr:prolipoprotein diacylglyceryl transferase [Celerinatantimonas diazotrophica]CAG9295799.1 Phosphatidylglycerol--prolipoprotein diacylglyceryl transferase [Celerinatantimonas diazotrophica]